MKKIIFLAVMFPILGFAQGRVTPFHWDEPQWLCPESEREVNYEVAQCINNYCYGQVYNEKTGKMEWIFDDPVSCKLDKCYPKGLQKLELYRLCVAAKQVITKEKEATLDAFIVKMGGYIHIIHPDGTEENFAGDRDLKEIKAGDQLKLNQAWSSAEISFPDGSEIHIDEFTTLKFLKDKKDGRYAVLDVEENELIYGEQRHFVELDQGRIRVKVFPPFVTKFGWTTEFRQKLDEYKKKLDEHYDAKLAQELDRIESEFIEENFHRKKYRISTPSAIITDSGTDFIVAHDPDTGITSVYTFEGMADVYNLKGEKMELKAGESVAVGGDGKMVFEKLSEEKFAQLNNEVDLDKNLDEVGPPAAETQAIAKDGQEAAAGSSKKSVFGLIAALLCLIGAGIFIYYRKKS